MHYVGNSYDHVLRGRLLIESANVCGHILCRYADRLTPLSAATKAGKHEIVAYLLSIPGVSAEGVATDEVQVSNHGSLKIKFRLLRIPVHQ